MGMQQREREELRTRFEGALMGDLSRETITETRARFTGYTDWSSLYFTADEI